MLEFTNVYNHEYRHSGIRFVTPAQRHQQQDAALLEKRKAVYEQAKSDYTQRWTGRATRNWSSTGPIYLNPEREIVQV
jgi:putative transposase